MKLLLSISLFLALALAAPPPAPAPSSFRLSAIVVKHPEYLAIKDGAAILGKTPGSTIVTGSLNPEPVGMLYNGTTPGYLMPTQTKGLYDFRFGGIPKILGVEYTKFTFIGSGGHLILAYDAAPGGPSRYEGEFRAYKNDGVWDVKFAKDFGVPTDKGSMIELRRELVT